MQITGQERIAEVFGVAPKTIVEWQEQGFPVAVRGGPGVPSQYSSQDCVAWLVQREVRKVQGNETTTDRLKRVQAERIEMDMAKDRGQLLPADQIEPLWAASVLKAREHLLSQPPRLASILIGMEKVDVENILRAEFETFLRKLAEWKAPDDEDDEEPDDEGEDE
jgi:terminase small subunit / prophage DNA-packing protein